MSQAETNVIDFAARRNAVRTGTIGIAIPPGADGEFVLRCDQLIAVINAIACSTAPVAPLHLEFRHIQRQLSALPRPHTGEGVRAAAKMMVAYCEVSGPDVEGWSCELWALLSQACAEYLAALPALE